jgi:hypothetical protein
MEYGLPALILTCFECMQAPTSYRRSDAPCWNKGDKTLSTGTLNLKEQVCYSLNSQEQ